jgi:serine/threonine protein kinase
MTEVVPRQIGRYEIQGVIGRGAMGVILRAHDPDLERTLAIKLIARSLLEGADGDEYMSRFRREARASSRCPHPNIVAVHDFGIHEGQPYLAMEFVEGVSLQTALAAGRRLTVAEATAILGQVLDALGTAHAAGIVHRDIKPANLLLLPDMRCKVADFGIARLGDSDLTRVGDMIGSPSYMSPEQCLGEPVDARSDLFSAGSVLLELLAGERAFGIGNMMEVVYRVIHAKPVPLPPHIVTAFPGLPGVLARAMAKRAADRFPDAAGMAAAMRAATLGGGAADATLVVSTPPRTAPAGIQLDGAALTALERNLAAHVGPIAAVLLRSALREASTTTALCEKLAESIPDPEARRRFRQEATRSLSGVATQSTAGAKPMQPAPAGQAVAAGATPAELEMLRKALLPFVGPIAALMVRRAAADGAPLPVLWTRTAEHIEDPAERARYLAGRLG